MYYGGNNTDDKYITNKNDKYSCKGIQKKDYNTVTYEQFEHVLHGGKHNAVNKGFRYHGGIMKTYEQSKCGISAYYCQRAVCDDERTTTPITYIYNIYISL